MTNLLDWVFKQLEFHSSSQTTPPKEQSNMSSAPGYKTNPTPGDIITTFQDKEIVIKDLDELNDVLQLVVQMWRSEFDMSIPVTVRLHGKSASYALYFVLTDIIVEWKPSTVHEMLPVEHLLVLAPEWIRNKIEPLVIKWRYSVHKDPDMKNMFV